MGPDVQQKYFLSWRQLKFFLEVCMRNCIGIHSHSSNFYRRKAVGSTMKTFTHGARKQHGPAAAAASSHPSSPKNLGENQTETDLNGNPNYLREKLLRRIDMGDGESSQMAERILNQLKSIGAEEDCPCETSELYPPHMTPLMLACIKNNFHFVHLMLNRGHQIQMSHRSDCKCVTCIPERKFGEGIESKIRRIDVFRAMTSSAYLWMASHDPILLAINLTTELEKCAEIDHQFKDDYLKMSERVRKFAQQVAQHCDRSETEVRCLLSRKEGIPVAAASFPLPRVRLALDANMKEMCSVLGIQSGIEIEFMGKWADWKVTPPAKNFFYRYLPHTLGYPFTSLIFLFSGGRFFKSYNYPYARYLSYFTSYVLFLMCLIYLIQDNSEGNVRGFSRKMSKFIVGTYTWTYIFGMIWFDFLGLAKVGVRRFFATWWNWFDVAQSSLFMFAFVAVIRSELDAHADGLRHMERKNWVFWDSQLVAESVYATATVISFWRVFYFLQLQRAIGPTIISIGKCLYQIFLYLIIMAAILFSFSTGIKFMYYGYAGYHYQNPKTGETLHQGDHFLTWPETLRLLYWSFYGYLTPLEQEMITGDLGLGRKPQEHGHWLNETIAQLLLASFHICCIIVLLNLMIAMICTVASTTIENEDVEWKFVRCHVWAEFFEESNSLPPPFNIFHWFASWIEFLFSKRQKSFTWPDLWYYTTEIDEKENKEYLDLMKTLYKRYVSSEQRSWKTASETHQNGSVKSVRMTPASNNQEVHQRKSTSTTAEERS